MMVEHNGFMEVQALSGAILNIPTRVDKPARESGATTPVQQSEHTYSVGSMQADRNLPAGRCSHDG